METTDLVILIYFLIYAARLFVLLLFFLSQRKPESARLGVSLFIQNPPILMSQTA